VQPILNVLKNYKINGMVHNTGGGFYDNIPRVLPNGCRAILDKNSFPVPPVFSYLAAKGGVPEAEMYRTFNMGIGFMAIVEEKDVNDIMLQFSALGETPYLIGEVQTEAEQKTRVEFI
jgi:phosphoribosylformylglycinamidine cyclo-ligase